MVTELGRLRITALHSYQLTRDSSRFSPQATPNTFRLCHSLHMPVRILHWERFNMHFFLLVIRKVNIHLPVCWHSCSFSCQFLKGRFTRLAIYAHSEYYLHFCAWCFRILPFFFTKILNVYLLQSVIMWITFLWLHFQTLPTTNHKEDTCFIFHV